MNGFRAMTAIAALCAVLGAAQLGALFVRDDPYPLCAAALALLLSGGGAVLLAFVVGNARRGASRERDASGLFTALALGLLAGLSLYVLGQTRVFFPLRMTLLFKDAALSEDPLPMMLAGTCLLSLGAACTAALLGALWLALYALGLRRLSRALGAALSLGGAIPYAAFALVVRTLVCGPVAFLAAGRTLSLRPDEPLAYRSLLGLTPGLLAASLALGLSAGRGLWSWLEQVRAAEEQSDSFLTARVRGERPWQIVLRQGLWLRRRRDLGALFLGGMAAAALIDILSNTLIDSFRPPGFPPYPSLGAALFLRGLTEAGTPAPLPLPLQGAHALVVLASLLLLLAQTLPHRLGRVALREGSLSVSGHVLASGVSSGHGLVPRPALQWVLGASGAGKSSLLHAWSEELPHAVLVPQDPDRALPASLSAAAVARLAARPRGAQILWDLLGRMDDERVRRRLSDPFTPVSAFSRGERQRLLVALALTRARGDAACTLLLDEPTSAQDAGRTHALLDCVRELLGEGFAGTGSLVLASHDPEALDGLLGDRRAVADHVLWLDAGRALPSTVLQGRREGAPPGLGRYLEDMESLLAARALAPQLSTQALARGVPLPRTLRVAGQSLAVAPQAQLREGQLAVLSGPSGCGKSTLLRALTACDAEVGYVAQDPSRAFPAEMPVSEVLGKARLDGVRRWFGEGFTPALLQRPVSALSEGERHRVLLAGEALRLEATDAPLRVLLLDEPFGALDPAAHLRLLDTLVAWLQEAPGRAAVLVSHSPTVDLGLARQRGVATADWSFS